MKRDITSIIIVFFVVALYSRCSIKEATAEYQNIQINFGQKLNSDTIKGKFLVKNIGDQDLIIEAVEPTCGCTVPEYSKKPILKNETGKINFIYIPKPNDSGTIVQKIVVKTNSFKRLQVLTVTGYIKKI